MFLKGHLVFTAQVPLLLQNSEIFCVTAVVEKVHSRTFNVET